MAWSWSGPQGRIILIAAMFPPHALLFETGIGGWLLLEYEAGEQDHDDRFIPIARRCGAAPAPGT